MENNSKIEEVLLKVALGYQVAEVTEEYAEVDGKLRLTKRKKTKKDVPPDLKAVQLLLEQRGGSLAQMSDEELEKEKARLLEILRSKTETGGQVCVESEKTAVKKVKSSVSAGKKTTARSVVKTTKKANSTKGKAVAETKSKEKLNGD